jgi:hypothetical protein
MRSYVGVLNHPQGGLLVTLALRRAAACLHADASLHPVKTALVELHALLAKVGEGARPATPEASLDWRLRRWTAGEPLPRAVPPIRLGHMAPERFSAVGSSPRYRGADQPFGPSPALPAAALTNSK